MKNQNTEMKTKTTDLTSDEASNEVLDEMIKNHAIEKARFHMTPRKPDLKVLFESMKMADDIMLAMIENEARAIRWGRVAERAGY